MVKIPFICLLFCIMLVGNASIYDQYLPEARKIAWAMTIQQKIGQTIQLTFDGLTQKQVTDPTEATKFFLGSVLVGGNGAPTADGNLAKLGSYLQEEKNKAIYLNATAANWKKLTDKFNSIGVTVTTAEKKKYLIKLLLGTDAVHGDQHSVGNVIFPHNLGLSCSHNADNFENVGYWTKEGLKKSGFNFAFAPCVAVTHNPQWGRTYETMGQQDEYIEKYAKAFVKGLQQVTSGKIKGALASAKHFFGDGSTRYGANQGTATVHNFKNYIEHNIKGYRGAISAEVGNVMVSYSSINFVPNSGNSAFLTGVLRDEQSFSGFTISDYDDLTRYPSMSLPRTLLNITQNDAYALMVNAGVDMFMVSGHKNLLSSMLERVIKEAKKSITHNQLFLARLQESVARILAVKFAMGLVTLQSSQTETVQQVEQQQVKAEEEVKTYPASSSTNEYVDSLNAVQQSLVVLKNANSILPVKTLLSDIKYVVLVGEVILNVNRLTRIQLFRNFDNIGMQCGGWTVRWQGYEGNDFWKDANKVSSNASSVLDALKALQTKNNFTLIYPNYTTFTNQVQIQAERRTYIEQLKTARKSFTSKNTLIIGVFGQVPYAESEGDVNIPYCKNSDLNQFCLYSPVLNAYVSGEQSKDLTVDFSKFQAQIISQVRGGVDKAIPLVSVLLTGRPVPISNIYENSNAVIAAWLPGTSGGQGIVNAISGAYLTRAGGETNRKNSLSVDWPKTMKSVEDYPIYGADGAIPKMVDIQFPVGFGLTTGASSQFKIVEQ